MWAPVHQRFQLCFWDSGIPVLAQEYHLSIQQSLIEYLLCSKHYSKCFLHVLNEFQTPFSIQVLCIQEFQTPSPQGLWSPRPPSQTAVINKVRTMDSSFSISRCYYGQTSQPCATHKAPGSPCHYIEMPACLGLHSLTWPMNPISSTSIYWAQTTCQALF